VLTRTEKDAKLPETMNAFLLEAINKTLKNPNLLPVVKKVPLAILLASINLCVLCATKKLEITSAMGRVALATTQQILLKENLVHIPLSDTDRKLQAQITDLVGWRVIMYPLSLSHSKQENWTRDDYILETKENLTCLATLLSSWKDYMLLSTQNQQLLRFFQAITLTSKGRPKNGDVALSSEVDTAEGSDKKTEPSSDVSDKAQSFAVTLETLDALDSESKRITEKELLPVVKHTTHPTSPVIPVSPSKPKKRGRKPRPIKKQPVETIKPTE